MKKRSIWKKNAVFSIKLSNGLYALIQTFDESGKIAVLNHFQASDNFSDMLPSHVDVLFMCWVTKNIFRCEQINPVIGLKPWPCQSFPEQFISLSGSTDEIVFWQGTENERKIITFSGEQAKYISTSTPQKSGLCKITYEEIDNAAYPHTAHLEMDAVRAYPEFLERLKLCSEKKANFDPMKEIAFQRPLGTECIKYVDIIGGRVRLDEIGY